MFRRDSVPPIPRSKKREMREGERYRRGEPPLRATSFFAERSVMTTSEPLILDDLDIFAFVHEESVLAQCILTRPSSKTPTS